MKKQPQKTEVTRKKLFEAFWNIYCEKNFEKISIKEIVLAAGYNRSTFYEYFTDIFDLLEQFENMIIDRIKESIADSFSADSHAIDRIANLYDANGKYISTLVSKNGNVRFINKLKEALKPLIMQELHIPNEDVRIALVMEFVASGIISTVSYWYNAEGTISSEELVAMLRRILSDGVVKELTYKEWKGCE